MTVWVTGAAGMLGQEVVRQLEAAAGTTVIATDREVDITSTDAVAAFWNDQGSIDWIVNCAAWTAVDAAEENEDSARRLNVDGPRVLAEAAADRVAAMVHISTDYVFSGDGTRPYLPDDPTDPRSVYGRTKRDGEDAVRAALERHVILRTAWLYGPGGKNFVATMLRLMNERDEIGVVADQFGLPTYAPHLAAAIARIVSRPTDTASPAWGTYHFTNAPGPGEETSGISWHTFAATIHDRGRATGAVQGGCTINALTTAEYPTAAARPAYSVLDCASTVETFGVKRPAWRDGLSEFVRVVSSPND